VWAMAMDKTGEASGRSQAGRSDGSVGSVRELGYAWGVWLAKWLDVAVPFGRGLDQVFLP